MFQVRNNCFETNSSSCHSLVITNKDNGRYTPEEALKELDWETRDGYWEPWGKLYFGRHPFQVLSTFEEKLRYVYAHTPFRCRPSKKHRWNNYSAMYWVINNKIKKFLPGYKGIKVRRKTRIGTDDYCLWGWLKKADITLEEFLMNKNIIVICDGDEYCVWTGMKKLGLVNKNNIKMSIPEREWWENDE